MDPLATIVVALTTAVAHLSDKLIKDAYEGVKGLIKRKYGDASSLAGAVEQLESKPDSAGRRAVVEEELSHSKATADAELVEACKQLLTIARSNPKASKTIQNVQQAITGNYNIAAGIGNIHVVKPEQ